ncbi:hypothetical protein E308F_22000 [Moorella sp. E308F]|uniref:DUF2273 domain-containing protein n=1 Tax=unclassified Neomoorella TaxID=2676739 RepID=UPI0010FFC1F2|nr:MULTISPECIES: DUF2273 domain-containing protein [unclassified Moorella (in: firmicutes)]GEA15956.1 hypothetical protein E308F_22000 [Moorella sp. E308F]GEA19226.1 hypothetical protein E306M_23640 [Moorella sp. E306M]
MENIFDLLGYLWREHRGKLIGVTLGLIFGILTAIWGFGKAFFIGLCVALGYVIGRRLDQGRGWEDLWQRFFGRRW